MLSLKNMQAQQQQQQQLAPLILQQHQLQLSQAQMQQRQMQQQEADQAGLRQAYVEGGGDPEKIGPLLNKYKVSPDGQARFSQSVTAGRESRAKLNKAEADAQDSMNNIALPRLQAFRSKPKEYQQQNWGAFNRMLHQDHGMNDEHYAQVLKQHPDLPDDDTLDIYEASMKGSKAEMDRRKTAAAITASESANTKNTQAIAKADDQKVLGQLRGATSLDQWNKILADNGRGMNDFGPPPFDTQTGEGGTERTPDQGALRRLNRMGMTSAEIATDDRAIATAAETKRKADIAEADRKIAQGQRDRALGQGDQRIAIEAGRAAKESATQRRNDDYALAQRALKESNTNGGNWDGKGGYEAAIDNVTNFYDGDEIGKNRGGVLKALREMQAGNVRQETGQANLDKKTGPGSLEKMQWAEAHPEWKKTHPGQIVPTAKDMADWTKKTATTKKTAAAPKPVVAAPAVVPNPPPAAAPVAAGPAAPATAPQATTPPAPKPAADQPKIPAAAQAVHDMLKQHHVPFSVVDGADGLPLLEKDGKQYKVLGVDKDGSLKLLPGTWTK